MANFLGSQQTGMQNVSTTIDPDLKQAYLNQINFANTVASRPYQQYQGPQVAGFSADQQQAFGAMRNLASGPQSFLQGNISQYMNPYTSQVINQSMSDLDRARQLQQQQVNAQALSRGAFGGSRQAIGEAENNRNFLEQQARTSAQLRNQGFDTAAGLMQQDINRSNAAIGGLAQFGGLQQQLGQRNLDVAKSDFERQFNYPLQQLAIRQSALPQPDAFGGMKSTPIFENTAGNIIGAAATGAGALKDLGITGTDIFNAGRSIFNSLPSFNFLGGLGNLFGGSSSPAPLQGNFDFNNFG